MSDLPKPLVSVIIPTYNRPYLLKECLASLTQQTYKNFDVCVVNDGGESVTEVIAQFENLNITLFESEHNQGQVSARNKAVELAEGRIISLCDDDDRFLPNHLELLTSELPDYNLVYSDVEIVAGYEDNNAITDERLLFSFSYNSNLLRKTNLIIPSSALYKKSLHEKLGAFDERAGSYWDWDWVLRVSKLGRMRHVPEVSVHYRFDKGGRNMSADPDSRIDDFQYFCNKHQLGELPCTNFYAMAKYGLKEIGIVS